MVLGGALLALSPLGDNDYLRLNGSDWKLFGHRVELLVAFIGSGLVLTAGGAFLGASREKRLEREVRQLRATTEALEKDNEDLRREKAQFEDRYAATLGALSGIGANAMIRLSKELGLGNTERATLVVVDDERFRQVGRYAHRPQYAVPGRGRYPLTHGCMGVAWTEGAAEVKELPDPTADSVAYRRELKLRVGMAAADVRAQTMPSRSYAARRIEDPSGEVPLGVVVIESTQPSGVSLTGLNDYLDPTRMLELAHTLRVLSQIKSEARVAREAGF